MGRWITVCAVGAAAVLALLVAPTGPAGSDEARGQPSGGAGSIVGSWKLNCENADGMVVEMLSPGAGAAVGRVKALGLGKRFHYKVGDEIIRVKAAAGGAWSGQFQWRNQTGTMRWQPITMRLVNGKLHGVTEAEYCYENMERAR